MGLRLYFIIPDITNLGPRGGEEDFVPSFKELTIQRWTSNKQWFSSVISTDCPKQKGAGNTKRDTYLSPEEIRKTSQWKRC